VVDGEIGFLANLTTADLHALRLAAQVMRHKAELDERPYVADYFARLNSASTGVLATRGEAFRVVPAATALGLDAGADAEDRRVLAELLGLLVANEHLSAALRDVSRDLRSRHCR
jgi:hypothetical protein